MGGQGEDNRPNRPPLYVVSESPLQPPERSEKQKPDVSEGQVRGAIDRFVGAEIEKRRKSLGMSQRELANLLRISARTIDSYENGSARIDPESLTEIAAVLKTQPSTLFQNYLLHSQYIYAAKSSADSDLERDPAARRSAARLLRAIIRDAETALRALESAELSGAPDSDDL